MDAPRNSDAQHAPEAPKTNTRTPASIFHFNSIWATPVLRPNSRTSQQCHAAAMPQRRNPVLCNIRPASRKRLICQRTIRNRFKSIAVYGTVTIRLLLVFVGLLFAVEQRAPVMLLNDVTP